MDERKLSMFLCKTLTNQLSLKEKFVSGFFFVSSEKYIKWNYCNREDAKFHEIEILFTTFLQSSFTDFEIEKR